MPALVSATSSSRSLAGHVLAEVGGDENGHASMVGRCARCTALMARSSPARRDRCGRPSSECCGWQGARNLGDRCPRCAAEVHHAVDGDLARSALEFLQHVGASAEGERVRSSGVTRRHQNALLDEEASVRGRRRRRSIPTTSRAWPTARRSPTASMTSPTTVRWSRSGSITTPPSSPSRRSRHGTSSSVVSATPTPRAC